MSRPIPMKDGRQVSVTSLSRDELAKHMADLQNFDQARRDSIDAQLDDDESPAAKYFDQAAPLEKEARIKTGFVLRDEVPDGGLIRPWQGAVRFDFEREVLITWLVPFNLIGRALWAVIAFVKTINHSVDMDPRNAWLNGREVGAAEERENGPSDVRLQATIAAATLQKGEQMQREAARYAALQVAQDEFDKLVDTWIAGTGRSLVFPYSEYSELRTLKRQLTIQADGAATS